MIGDTNLNRSNTGKKLKTLKERLLEIEVEQSKGDEHDDLNKPGKANQLLQL